MTTFSIRPATRADLESIRELLREYADWLGRHVNRVAYENELEALPGEYAPPAGALLVAELDHRIAGCIGLRPLDDHRCELKRLFVLPDCRRQGLGRRLVTAALDVARERGYQSVCVDTVPGLDDAERLYTSLGFTDIPPYYDNARFAVRFMAFRIQKPEDSKQPP